MKTEQEINDEILKLENILSYKEEGWNFDRPYFEYEKMREPEASKIEKLKKELKLIQTYTLSPVSEDTLIMNIKDFINAVNKGFFIDYDGHGYYVSDENMESDIMIIPSDISMGIYRKDFKKISWYNR